MNKVFLMGRLTKDPELRYVTNDNVPVCSYTLAVDRKFQKPGEERQADFIPIVAWRSTAEFCSKYFTKGMRVVVIGNLQVRSWDDNEGKKRYVTEVVAEEVHFADAKKGESGAMKDMGVGTASAGVEFLPDVDDELPF